MSGKQAVEHEAKRGPTVPIEIVPDGPAVRAGVGEVVLDVLQSYGVRLDGSCGGHGTCGECRIRYVDDPPVPTAADRDRLDASALADGWRLACAHRVGGPMRIELRSRGGELDHKAAEGDDVVGRLDPAVRSRTVRPPAPTREDQRSLASRLVDALGPQVRIPVATLRSFAKLPRGADAVSVVECGHEIVAVRPGTEAPVHGLAIDVGTTTLAVYLFDLATGRRIAAAASRNPQRRFGADVIARIAHVRKEQDEGLAALRAAALDGVDALIERVVADASISRDSIYAATIVGNPTMVHLLLGIDPRGIDVSPYVPVFGDAVRCRAEDVGLGVHPLALVETLPAVSGYVGADIVAGVLATGLGRARDNVLFLDVGTNGEIVLALDGRLMACSTAAGPAFEGASIVQGMPALDGAIETVAVRDGRIECTVIGGAAPVGICGTGLVSAVAELRAAGVIDASGRLARAASGLSGRIEGAGAQRRFRLTDGDEPVYLHQADVREFQLAKAAIRAGVEVLLRHAAIEAKRLDRALVAGAFSARLSAAHLIETGLLPPLEASRIEVVGNTAGQGAKRVLLDRESAKEAQRLARRIEYLELSADSRFTELYVAQMALPGPD